MDVLRDSAIGLHREYFNYEETVDARDILAQVSYKHFTAKSFCSKSAATNKIKTS
ncbi:unnamed protein product [Cylicostephanus goldi]|uniref:Uncharacterized protein n=1 Tax=Cylicostephanus goldi TaxID=71465 RepID=A0A3P6TM95_CYLGO|nr:unnamed protein product [Cylicostephanus goldi]